MFQLVLGCKRGGDEAGGDGGGLPYPVVVEQVTNYLCVPCKGANEIIDSLDGVFGEKLVVVRYHVNDPYDGDPLYTPYSDQVLSLYSLNTSSGVPITVIAGEYKEHGYDESKHGDYVERWMNVIEEKAQVEPSYKPTVDALMGDSVVKVGVDVGGSLPSGYTVRTLLTEYGVPLPPNSVKPRSNYAVRAGVHSDSATFVLDTSWNQDNLFITVIVNSSDKRVVGAYQGKPGTYTLTNLSNDGDTTVPLNQYSTVYLGMENRSDRDLDLVFTVDGIPRDWSNTICWGVCLSDTNMVSNTLEAGATVGGHSMYFSVYPTTVDSATITVRVYLREDPRVFRQIKVRVRSQ